MNEPAAVSRPAPARQVDAREARSGLDDLLDRTARGEEFLIVRDGEAVARLVPPAPEPDRVAARRALARVRAFREELRDRGVAPFTTEEIIALRDAGRR